MDSSHQEERPTLAATSPELLALLLAHPILAACGEGFCRRALETYPLESVDGGCELATAGQPSESVDFLLDGAVRVFRCAEDDREILLRILAAPAVIGDAEALVRGARHGRSVETLEPCRALRIPAEGFRLLVSRVPALMQVELEHLASLHCATARGDLTALVSLEQRVANVLLSYARRYGEVQRDGSIAIEHPLSVRTLARSVGGVWRSVGHVVSRMRRAGLFGRSRDGRFVLQQPAELERLADPVLASLDFHVGIDIARAPRRRRTSAELAIPSYHASGGLTAEVEEEIVIGSTRSVDVLVSDKGVCPRHARVFRSPTGRYWIQDLQSELGTRVNDEPVRLGVLRHGDRIIVGQTEIVFRLKSAEQCTQAQPLAPAGSLRGQRRGPQVALHTDGAS